jgi:hypothetical protein
VTESGVRHLFVWLMSVLWIGTAHAATYDPDLTWRTLVTEHFRIHFHQGLEQLADELSQEVETIYAEVGGDLKWRVRMRTDVVLIDRTDRANGFATSVPYNAITIFVTAPWEDSTLSLYEDWGEAIFTHELTHVLHMETHHGVVTAARFVVGRVASTNDVSPWWVVEGLATFQETRHTAGGRGRTPYVDMIKRTAVVEDAWPWLGNLDGLQIAQPSGNLRYLFGQDFIQYVADHQGEDVWTKWIHNYGGHIPFLLPAKKTFGKTLQRLYWQWREDRRDSYGAQLAAIEAEGVREGVRVSDDDANCSAPSFAPDNSRLIWSCFDLQTGSALWTAEIDGSGAQILKQDFGAKSFTWRRDSQAFVYAGTHIVNRFNTWSDIYLFDLRTGAARSLTNGARARDPDFSPDGSRLMMVTNRAQDSQLELLTVDQRRDALTAHTDHTQYATPRYSPDGRVVAVSIWQDGSRDLWLVDPAGQPLRRLTLDPAIDRDPFWTPDGRHLLFSSDRSGVPNIYAIDLATERLWQVTNVRTGAAKPAVSGDGTTLGYDHYSQDGWEVRIMPLDPAQWIDRGLLPRAISHHAPLADLTGPPAPTALHADASQWRGDRLETRRAPGVPTDPFAAQPGVPPVAQDGEVTDSFVQARVADAFGEEREYPFQTPPHRYNPLPSLLPRYWLPSFNLTPRLPVVPDNPVSELLARLPFPLNIPGFQFTASTGTSDPLRRYGYNAWVSYRTDADFWGGGGSFTLNHWLPVFTVSASTQAIPRLYSTLDEASTVTTGEPTLDPDRRLYFERRISTSLVMNYPFSVRSTIFAAYDFSDRRSLNAIATDAWAPSVPLRGRLGRLSVGYRYAWSQPTSAAISQEDARTFSAVAGITAPWLGSASITDDGAKSPITQVQLSAELREYVVNPWVPNHVLALRAAAGAAFNLQGEQFLGNWQLGGNLGDGAFYVRPAEYRMLRGYPYGAAQGDTYWLAGAEYRFPIWRMDRGFGTVPAFFRVLHGAVFVDAGNAFSEVDGFTDVFDDALVGVGAELRLSTVVWWSGGLDFRLGWAVGATRPDLAITPTQPQSVYLQLGSAF